jgi:hypothetical protein
MMSNIRQKGSEPEYDEYDENPTKSNRNLYIGLGIAAVIISLIIYFVVYKPQRDAAAAAAAAKVASEAAAAAYLVRPGAAAAAAAAKVASEAAAAAAKVASEAAAAYLVRPGVWRKGSIGGDYSKRKLAELFKGTYPTELPKCINRAKNSNYKYIAAHSQSGDTACVFYNDDGVTPSAISVGDIVDIENTSYAGELHYAMP